MGAGNGLVSLWEKEVSNNLRNDVWEMMRNVLRWGTALFPCEEQTPPEELLLLHSFVADVHG